MKDKFSLYVIFFILVGELKYFFSTIKYLSTFTGGSNVSQPLRESVHLTSPAGETDDAIPGVAAVQEVPSVVSYIAYFEWFRSSIEFLSHSLILV